MRAQRESMAAGHISTLVDVSSALPKPRFFETVTVKGEAKGSG
jgi:hypothetical protein